jgi:hypothetical protein
VSPSGLPHEQSLWEMVYRKYLTDNYDKHFLYSMNSFVDDNGRKEEVIYILGIANNQGFVFEFSNGVIFNTFEFVLEFQIKKGKDLLGTRGSDF